MTHTPFVSNPCPATAIVFVSQNLFYGQLPQEDRLLVSLHLNGGLRFRECARLLGIPLGTALRRYHTAIGRVRDYLNG